MSKYHMHIIATDSHLHNYNKTCHQLYLLQKLSPAYVLQKLLANCMHNCNRQQTPICIITIKIVTHCICCRNCHLLQKLLTACTTATENSDLHNCYIQKDPPKYQQQKVTPENLQKCNRHCHTSNRK